MTRYELAEKAIMDVFGDTSVPPGETRESLQGLIDHIQTLIESLPEEEI